MSEVLNTPLVFIIIVTWNHWEVTDVSLSLLQKLSYPNYQIVVVDNGSTDNTVAYIRSQYPEVFIIENGRNLGFGRGCNIGIEFALDQNAAYVLLLNNDTQFPLDLLDKLVQATQDLPHAGIVTPAIRYLSDPNKLWFTGSYRHPLTLEAVDFGHSGPRRHVQPDKRHTVDYIFGTAMLIPTPVLQRAGLFDEAFFLYYEDMDLCLRVQAAGYQLYYIPEIAIHHSISASTNAASNIRYYHKARSSVVFFRKHTNLSRCFIVVPYRLGSAIHTVARLAWQKEWSVIIAYLYGLRDGFYISPQIPSTLHDRHK